MPVQLATMKMPHALHSGSEGGIMSDEHNSEVQVLLKFEEKINKGVGIGFVERAGGFIGKEQLGLIDQGTNHGNPLTFPARELGWALVLMRTETNSGQQCAGT